MLQHIMARFPLARRALAALLVPVAALPGPARARTPVMAPTHAYYGPLRICDRLFAFDVRAGEGYLDGAWGHIVRFGGRYLGVGQRWLYAGESFRDIVRPLGTLDLPGAGLLERIELGSRNGPDKTIVYLHDTHDGGPYPKMEIRSDAFDGSERDLTLLNRVVFGDRARAMCADPPEALRPRPEREDANAMWVRPDRPAGPLTLCWAGLALDVRSGEAAIPSWRHDWDRFGVAAGGGWTVAMTGRFQILRDQAGRPFEGPLAVLPDFDVREVAPMQSGVAQFTLGNPAATRTVQLSRKVDVPNLGPRLIAGVTFAFNGPATPADIADLVGRLRPRLPGDICLEEDSR
jgi:hypothetical protein